MDRRERMLTLEAAGDLAGALDVAREMVREILLEPEEAREVARILRELGTTRADEALAWMVEEDGQTRFKAGDRVYRDLEVDGKKARVDGIVVVGADKQLKAKVTGGTKVSGGGVPVGREYSLTGWKLKAPHEDAQDGKRDVVVMG